MGVQDIVTRTAEGDIRDEEALTCVEKRVIRTCQRDIRTWESVIRACKRHIRMHKSKIRAYKGVIRKWETAIRG